MVFKGTGRVPAARAPTALDEAQRAYDAVKGEEPLVPTDRPCLTLAAASGQVLVRTTVHESSVIFVFENGYAVLGSAATGYDDETEISENSIPDEKELAISGLVTSEQAKEWRAAHRTWEKRYARAMDALERAEKREQKQARKEKRPRRKASW